MTTRVVVDQTRFLLEETEETLFITAISARLAQRDVPGGKHVVVRAYDVTITEALTLPGRNVEIYCRTLRTTKDITVDTSGTPGTDMSLSAPNGRSASEGGTRGEPGGHGGHAGNIRIIAEELIGDLACRANGGPGGKGQNGGNGARGGVGRDGSDADLARHGGQGEHGGSGGRGGDAAPGGRGGNGGNAGTIELQLVKPVTGRVQITAEAGSEGNPGANGNPGPGGPGGRGGQQRACDFEPNPRI